MAGRANASTSLDATIPITPWCLVQCHVQRLRDLLRHTVDLGVRHPERAADVAHDCPGLHGAEGDDLRDVLPAVFPCDVLDDLAPAPLAEVDVDVRQLHPLGIEESLEDEIELQRIDICDLETIGDEAAGCRSTPRADRNPLLPRVANEIPDDQEIALVAHLLDDVDLVVEPALVVRDRMLEAAPIIETPKPRESFLESLSHDVAEVLAQRERLGDVEVGELMFRGGEVDVAALGNLDRVMERLRMIAENGGHLTGLLEIELVAVVAQAVHVVHVLPGPDAQENVVGVVVRLPEVVHIVGTDEGHPQISGDRLQHGSRNSHDGLPCSNRLQSYRGKCCMDDMKSFPPMSHGSTLNEYITFRSSNISIVSELNE